MAGEQANHFDKVAATGTNMISKYESYCKILNANLFLLEINILSFYWRLYIRSSIIVKNNGESMTLSYYPENTGESMT